MSVGEVREVGSPGIGAAATGLPSAGFVPQPADGRPATTRRARPDSGTRRAVPLTLFRRSKRRNLVEVPARADVLALAGVLLSYPDEAFNADAPALGAALADLPDSEPAASLRRFWAAFTAMEPDKARQHYVDTFDMRRNSALHISYYVHGDTRERGMALLAIKQRYRACGFNPDETQLPDYLPMVLEFAARTGTGAGEGILRSHRGGVELIRRTLADRGSYYLHILDAVSAVLGPVTARQTEEVDTLIATGPPSDDVGMEFPPTSMWTAATPGATPSAGPELSCASKGL